jgi:L-malate glycosyltransferase
VLHIFPHVGGGVGTVFRALLQAEVRDMASPYSHAVASLETINDLSKSCFDACGTPWAELAGRETINALVDNADMVLVHWWNHPLLMKLLFEGLRPARLALWSHVNGYAAPQSFFPELFEMPDSFIFATKASFNTPVVQGLPEVLRSKLRVIRSCAGIPEGSTQLCNKEGPFRIGYVGTVEPAKMSPDFLELCATAELGMPCIVAGGTAHEELRTRALALGILNRFEILGPVSDTKPIFRQLHAFAYPLSPLHYGSGEQVLIEAMAFGAVPVVFDNPAEKALIRHCETGLVAQNAAAFSAALRFLADNPAERSRMAAAGHRFVMENCDIRISREKFHNTFDEMAAMPKRLCRLVIPEFEGVESGSPFHLFLASCAGATEHDAALTIASGGRCYDPPPSFRFTTRGSPAHYLRMLGADACLELLCAACAATVEQKNKRAIL